MNAEIDVTGVVLKTERLTLRPWREEDLEDFYAYARVMGTVLLTHFLAATINQPLSTNNQNCSI